MKTPDPLENQDTRRLRLFLYLVPVLGFFPALWTLYRGQRDEPEQAVSRVAVILAFGWLFGYTLLNAGAPESDLWAIRLLITNSFLTSGYFLLSIWLMVRIWQRQTVELPSFNRLGKRVLK
ncbi:hypothetical protein [Merismopedia glauca]|uniref:Uncharacterized protein n=1 Tax=Merismopedia glauca CCAP 1448/3 TaxID=1296344 RepID=A0A2T1C8R8_9CYAN|nr:hypothetical protein [Merismopedia glauca]PSB04533.1 hypothetical protein C7B64_03695 [Merismopedia glauca CCAP 1448/3]